MHPLSLKQQAISLRKQGYSYSIIGLRLNVRKSTLNGWLGDLPYKPNKFVLKRMRDGKMRSALTLHRRKQTSIRNANAEALKTIGKLSERDVFLLGLGIYIGEGSKTHAHVEVINADPRVIRFAVNWFTKICGVPLSNLRLYLHCYPDTDINATLRFWSRATGIPRKQFNQTTVDLRTKKSLVKRGVLPYGTIRLHVNSCGNPRLGVYLHRMILAWIGCALSA